MHTLTGIKIAMADIESKPQITLDAKDPLAQGVKTDEPVGAERLTVSPIFYADDPDARVAGRLVDGNRPGLVVKKMDGWTSIYSGAMQLPPALMRAIARSGGVHIWIETDDALYTDGQFAGVHAATDGEKRLNLPTACKVGDAISGRPVAVNGQTVTLNMKRAETILLRLEPTQ